MPDREELSYFGQRSVCTSSSAIMSSFDFSAVGSVEEAAFGCPLKTTPAKPFVQSREKVQAGSEASRLVGRHVGGRVCAYMCAGV